MTLTLFVEVPTIKHTHVWWSYVVNIVSLFFIFYLNKILEFSPINIRIMCITDVLDFE